MRGGGFFSKPNTKMNDPEMIPYAKIWTVGASLIITLSKNRIINTKVKSIDKPNGKVYLDNKSHIEITNGKSSKIKNFEYVESTGLLSSQGTHIDKVSVNGEIIYDYPTLYKKESEEWETLQKNIDNKEQIEKDNKLKEEANKYGISVDQLKEEYKKLNGLGPGDRAIMLNGMRKRLLNSKTPRGGVRKRKTRKLKNSQK